MAREDIKKYDFTSNQNRSKAAENGRKGGVASGKSKRRAKSLAEQWEILRNLPMTKGKIDEIESLTNYTEAEGMNVTVETMMALSIIKSAINGNVKASELILNADAQRKRQQLELEHIKMQNELMKAQLEQIREKVEGSETGGVTIIDDIARIISETK